MSNSEPLGIPRVSAAAAPVGGAGVHPHRRPVLRTRVPRVHPDPALQPGDRRSRDAVYPAQRKLGGVAAENARRSANWGLTVSILVVLSLLLPLVARGARVYRNPIAIPFLR